MIELFAFIHYLLQLYIYILIAAAVLSWLVAFNVVNTRNPIVAAIGEFLYRITEPVLRPIRNILPNMGGIDLSPVDRHPDHHLHPGGRPPESAETVPVTEGADRPFAIAPDGVILAVRLTPKGGRDAVDGIETLSDGRAVLKVRVRAAPFEGEANAALGRVLAKALGVPPGRVEIVGGATSRIKRVKISGDAAALSATLEKIARAG